MNLDEDIIESDLCDLISYFSKQTYSASSSDAKARKILDRCIDLFMKDYDISVLTNGNGELCGHYPQRIIIIESEILRGEELRANRRPVKINDISQLKPLIGKARLARCRSRFVVPVISFNGKNVCRSATLSSFAEIAGRSGFNFLFSSPVFPDDALCEGNDGEWDLVHNSRCQDIQLLKTLRVKYIFDLMLENKKVKYGMRITSSEKVDKENRYAEFCLCCIPYPGCEFFRVLKIKDYLLNRIHFDWNQDYVDADLNIPTEIESEIDCDWERYQRWDLATLTQNYFLLLLKTILNSDDGVLVHCISGWDRTPLFVSLLRLSLWADGLIHQSLDALEILYLTIAYDWLLFGHDLNDRMQRDEEVFFFCFHFLQYIMSDVYALTHLDRSSSETSLRSNNDTVSHEEFRNGDTLTESTCCREFFIGQQTNDENRNEENSSRSLDDPRSQNIPSVLHNGSTPLPVPGNNSVRNQAQCKNSLNAGSWQLISRPASLCSTAGSDSGYPSLAKRWEENGSSLSSCEEACEDSVRRIRLETVRSLFLKIYKNVMRDGGNEASSVTLSKLFNQLKPPWGK
ncbi:myotubularin-related protein 14-like [Dendronephthya gigantea]|uniref:myotubularin-related protein 14-like n=1 Tax=Dendronephthya gigantea TaxID=151771 RepID=UPI00106AAB87|nr:myotubularin-related protein 14-like [Dendronephthya gigantea]